MNHEQGETASAYYDELVEAGYIVPLAEALSEFGYTVDSAERLSTEELLECYLQWNGILGFTKTILQVVQNPRKQGG